MDTSNLKKFAQAARLDLIEQVSSKLGFVLKADSSARREYPSVVADLEKAITEQGEENLIDQVAYTWFNRFCALRFMDVNGYNRVGVVSPLVDQVQPEILAEAKSGVIDDTQFNQQTIDKVLGLLSGAIPSPDGQSEAYRQLIVGTCNALYKRMPYMFERIQDFTELLMPDDLLSENSVITKMRAAMTKEACQDVEVIGWLYQFYISEKKDAVFAALKKNQKITAENIPAATQLFTPHWIVRYLVENSLGRLWMLNRPQSKLTENMDYYIAPEEPETDFLKITSPEELKIADPAVGSGHMLTYAFDLLYAIYEEEGYDPNEIPSLILEKNLYGIEIDDRAGALAAFALEMKAAEKLTLRRFLKLAARPNICVLEDVSFTDDEMDDVISIVGQDLYTADLRETLTQFEQAKNFGSLIVPKLKDPAETARLVESKDLAGDMFLSEVHERILKVLRMAEFLAPKYHAVVANPPYLGSKGMNGRLSIFAKEYYPDSKSDLFSMFIERSFKLSSSGLIGMITMQSWMFLSRHQKLRERLIYNFPIRTMAHLGSGAFDSISGEVVSTTAFVLGVNGSRAHKGMFIDLREGRSEAIKRGKLLEAASNNTLTKQASSETFEAIEGQPIAYWISENFRSCFRKLDAIKDVFKPAVGLNTGDNDRFLRQWFEVPIQNVCFNASGLEDASSRGERWFPYNKGGGHRKWYGNQSHIINWQYDGQEVKEFATYRNKGKHWSRYIQNLDKMFLTCVTWSDISTSSFAARFSPKGFLFDVKGSSGVPFQHSNLSSVLSLLCSNLMPSFMQCVNPTTTFQVGDLARVPYSKPDTFANLDAENLATVKLARQDWDAYETSWGFTSSPLLSKSGHSKNLHFAFRDLRNHWQSMMVEMKSLEEENNRIFIEAYGLADELLPEVPFEEITLTCNPAYRYGTKFSEEEREINLKADTMREFLSYAVGCMFGRYSLDEPGLILANQGETLEDYLKRVPEPSFLPDDDNVIPLIDFDGDWFEDDITERFKQFLKVTFGKEHHQENIAFIEDALGKSIKKFFVKEFYADHVKRYKKRPIYWLFSSPKGTFNALIYMHRYTPSTVSVVLNEYLREFRHKMEARLDHCEQTIISAGASQEAKTKALKLKDKLKKAIEEVNDYEREILYPLAGQNISIDLDDGVKHNYPLFGKALKKVTGLS
jgi:type II restriction/modification system DNA methylase subunit YeeA